jgi:hypothetical protein
MSVHVYVAKCLVEKKFDCLEATAYVGAFCAWLDAAHMMGGHLKSAFVVTA